MDKVIAVIVTYNRQQLLSNCITALKNQTRKLDGILVINNGSTDETAAWLKKQKTIEHISQENLGSAGGFYTGIKTAFENGYNWIWLMDDDGYPKEDALEKLLEDDREELLLRNCAVIDTKDKKSFVWRTLQYKTIDEVKDKVIQNIAHPFNGTLLHRRIIERVGFPNPRLFLWGDETEYYYIRNRFHVHRSKFAAFIPLAYFMYAGFLLVFAFITLLFQKTDKKKKLAFILWPAKDALQNNFEATPASVLAKLRAKASDLKDEMKAYINVSKNIITGTPSQPLKHFEKA